MAKLRYLARRARQLPKAIFSPVGIVTVAAFVTGVAALLLGGSISQWLAGLSLLLWLGSLLMVTARLQTISRMSKNPDPRSKKSSSKASSGISTAVPRSEVRLASARKMIAQVSPTGVELDGSDDAGPVTRQLSEPFVSIVVPCFNDSTFLIYCLESVRDQAYEDWECIVVDDASTDDSVAVAWEFARTDDRFRVVRHARNAGLGSARNTGLRLAGGAFVTFLDSDDFLTSESLADRIQHLVPHMNDPGVAGVYCGAMLAPEDAVPTDYASGERFIGSQVGFVNAGDRCPFNVHAAIVRTAIVRDAGGFDESMRYGAEDWDLWYRVMRSGYRFVPSARTTAIYRQKRSSMRQESAIEHFAEATRLTKASQKPADVSDFSPNAIAPMPLPRSDYEVSARLARRSIQSAATALISGNEGLAISMIDAIEPVHPSIVVIRVQPEAAIFDGFRRYLGLSKGEFAKIEQEIAPLTAHAQKLANDHMKIIEVHHDMTAPSVDIALVPQTSAALRRMIDAVGTTDLAVIIVDSSTVAGNQGVTELLSGETPIPGTVMSINEAYLRDVQPKLVVISYPWDAGIDELALHFVGQGARVVSLVNDLEDVLRIEESPPSRLSVNDVTASDLGGLVVSADFATAIDDVRTSPEPTFDTGLLKYSDAAAAWAIEEYPDRRFDAQDIQRFKGMHAGERVVIIGNGPSLNDLDLSLMKGTATFGVNGIFYADDRLPEPLTYYVVEDTMVVRDNLERIQTYEAGHRFFPNIYREMIGESPNSTFFMMNRGFYADSAPGFCVPRFSTDPSQRVYAGQSVTIMNLQLAYYMGFTEVILIGMDFSYTVPESSEIKGNHITSMEDDPNHFHPDYFGKGKVWKDPKLERVLANYALAKQMYEADGRRIVNATPGGNLNLFERVVFEEALRQ